MKFFKSSLIFALCFLISSPLFLFSAFASGNENIATFNAYAGDYSGDYIYCSSPVYSHLTKDGDEFIRTEYDPETGKIIEERYSSDLSLASSVIIDPELPLYGGIYKDANENYVVTGKENISEDPNAEVIRITKYSKDWKVLGRASVSGENTVTPFANGSLKFLKYGDVLYIDATHTMFRTDDDLNHQSNMLISLDAANMKIKYVRDDIANVSTGYVSHSFNQFIALDESTGSIVTVDHGDAYPRSVALFKFPVNAGNYQLNEATYTDVFDISGEIGDNSTYCSVGGLAVSKNNYIISLSSADQSRQDLNGGVHKNVYITVTPKNNFKEGSTKVIKLTDYKDGDGELSAGTPKLVPLNSGRFLVIWNNQVGVGEESTSYNDSLSYVIIDGNGNKLSNIFTQEGVLSDCEPMIANNKVIWYVTEGSSPVFYSIDINTWSMNAGSSDRSSADINGDGKTSASDARVVLRYSAKLEDLSETQLEAADINADGKVTASDARSILRLSARLFI